MFKLGPCAEENQRKLGGFAYLVKAVKGVISVNGDDIERSDQVTT